MKLWSILFCMLICTSTMAAQTIDPRQYVDWSKCEYPYNQLVRLTSRTGLCTAQFVAPDIVATAMHCVASTKTGKLENNIRLQNCHGDWFPVTIVAHADTQGFLNNKPVSRNDWALLRVDNPKYYSHAYFNIDSEKTTPNKIPLTDIYNGYEFKYGDSQYPGFIGISAGWGALPILSDTDIVRIKSELKKRVAENNNGMQYNVNGGVGALYTSGYFDNITSDDTDRLKIHKNCNIYPDFAPHNSSPEHQSTCLIWAGNSGGAFFTEQDNTLHGVASTSIYSLPNQNIRDNKSLVSNYAPTREIYQLTGKYSNPQPQQPQTQLEQQPEPEQQTPQQEQQPQTQPEQQTTQPELQSPPQSGDEQKPQSTEPEINTPDISDEIPEENINNLGNNIDQGLQNLDNMSDYDFLILLGNIIDYNDLRKKYEAAKAREQSIPNKLLGGLTMAATGIGGMQLASGIAEQAADEAAEQDMRAYLATFRCDYGQGRNITGGETNIELPGGNDLLTYTNEYKQLAQNLKIDKEALGMMPGIESEVVFDKAETGLYDNVGIGTQPGAFTSLSRALLDENSADAKAWAEQKQSAKNKKNTGIALGATGAGAGIAGNIVINDILNKTKDTNTNNTAKEKQKQ